MLPGIGLAISGPLASALAGAGPGGVAGTINGVLAGTGIPKERADHYQKDIEEGRILSRLSQSASTTQVQACVEACLSCEGLCENHADANERGPVCAEPCRRCKEACEAVLEALDILPSA